MNKYLLFQIIEHKAKKNTTYDDGNAGQDYIIMWRTIQLSVVSIPFFHHRNFIFYFLFCRMISIL